MIKQILLTALVAVIVVLVVQSRRRMSQSRESRPAKRGQSPQALAGWVLLAVMLAAAIGAAFLQTR